MSEKSKAVTKKAETKKVESKKADPVAKKATHTSNGQPVSKRTEDVEKVRKYIRRKMDEKYGTMTAYAGKAGVSLQYISNVMAGNKPIPPWMLKHFRINHVVTEYFELS